VVVLLYLAFQSFQYNESGIIILTVQFDTSREAAFYLHELEQSVRVNDATLSSVTTEEVQSLNQEETESGILPRYIAQYSIVLNQTIEDIEVEEEVEVNE